jgi:predicted site-specific integrase-resolvase
MNIKLIRPKEAAEILMCSERTLEAWRREDKGPCYYKIEGKILYKAEDILNFIEESRVSIQ